MSETGFMEKIEISIKRQPGYEDIPLPQYATAHAIGMDLHAAVDKKIILLPGKRALIPTGICIALPYGVEAQIRPRSGLAIRYGVTILNSPGTVDSDYRGEIKVILVNLGDKPFWINRGDRIAQMVIGKIVRGTWLVTDKLTVTSRGSGGFGHTGI